MTCKFAIGQRWRWNDSEAICPRAGSRRAFAVITRGGERDLLGVRFSVENHEPSGCGSYCVNDFETLYDRRTLNRWATHLKEEEST